VTVVVLETVVPPAGAVTGAVGVVVVLTSVMVTAVAVVVLPAASRAIAVSVWDALLAVVVFQESEYGAVVSSAPRFAPSSRNWTPAPKSVAEAKAVTVVILETVDPTAWAVAGKSGA